MIIKKNKEHQKKKAIIGSTILMVLIFIIGLVVYNLMRVPYFSIIISSYNYGMFLTQAIDSILKSSYQNFEIIVVNDGSTDNTSELLQKYKNNHKIKIIEHENQGLSLSRNKAMRIAKGNYLWFVDADDWISKKALRRLYKKTQQFPTTDIVSFYSQPVNEQGVFGETTFYNELPKTIIPKQNETFTVDALNSIEIINYPVTSGKQIYKREFIEKNNILFPPKVIFEDDIFFLKSIFNKANITIIPEVLYYKRNHPNSITANRSKHFSSYLRICQLIFAEIYPIIEDKHKAEDVLDRYVMYIPTEWRYLNEEAKYRFYPELMDFHKYIRDNSSHEYWKTRNIRLAKFFKSYDVKKYEKKK